MKLGAFSCWFGERPLADVLDLFASVGITALEIGTGGYPGDVHCRPAELLADSVALAAFRETITSRGMEIAIFSCMGNPLHPDTEVAGRHHQQFRDSVLLAEHIGIGQVAAFAGCPGTPDDSRYPNWVTTTFPSEYSDLLDWQWRERVIPYWREQAAFCRDHGVCIALEPHPGMVVYNTTSLLRLRAAVGETIGAVFDPSHLWWQQMDPISVIQALGPAIFHVHAKDMAVNAEQMHRNGVLDLPLSESPGARPWLFRSLGFGHDAQFWKAMISALSMVGYRGSISIEAEDSLMSKREGLLAGARMLREALMVEKTSAPWWS